MRVYRNRRIVMRKIILAVAWLVWTLLCIYGTYNNTVKHASLVSHENGQYEIEYQNTGDIMIYVERE